MRYPLGHGNKLIVSGQKVSIILINSIAGTSPFNKGNRTRYNNSKQFLPWTSIMTWSTQRISSGSLSRAAPRQPWCRIPNTGTSPSIAETLHALKMARLLTPDHDWKWLLRDKSKGQVMVDSSSTVPLWTPVYRFSSEQDGKTVIIP